MDATISIASERKKCCQKVLLSGPSSCIFSDIKPHIDGRGKCLRHERVCELESGGSADLLSAGLPCHPFSDMRWKKGSTPGTQGVEQHGEYDLTMTFFRQALIKREPG